MRFRTSWVLIVGLSCAVGALGTLLAGPAGGPTGAQLAVVRLRLQNATADEELVRLAEAADANIICDATELPQRPLFTGEIHRSLGFAFQDLATERNISVSQWDDDTFLIRVAPDLEAMASVAAGSAGSPGGPSRRPSARPKSDPVGSAVAAYLRDRGKNASAPGFEFSARVRDLPPSVAGEVQQLCRSLEGASLTSATYSASWWSGARATLTREHDGGRWSTVFQVYGQGGVIGWGI